MARKKNYEKQAKLSVILAIIGGVCTLAGAFFILQRFSLENFWVAYNPKSPRLMMIGGALFLGLAFAGIGFFVAHNSAGQRLNKQNKLSWTGFFLSAAVVTLAMCCGVFFYLTRYAFEPMTGG